MSVYAPVPLEEVDLSALEFWVAGPEHIDGGFATLRREAGADLGEDRLANLRDDITSSLMHAELDGERLTPQEFGSFFNLLVLAGNETTRNAISHGMKALTDFPDQRRVRWDDFEAGARNVVEEIVRWATPVVHFRRTATADTETGRPPLLPGRERGPARDRGHVRRDPPAVARPGGDQAAGDARELLHPRHQVDAPRLEVGLATWRASPPSCSRPPARSS